MLQAFFHDGHFAMTDTPELAAPTLPTIVALLDERFRPSAVQVTQAEWAMWAASNDAEVRARLQDRLVPPSVPLTAREWLALRALLFEAMGEEAAGAVEHLERVPPYATHAQVQSVPEPLRTLVMRFRSANACPVDRIHVQRTEWAMIRPIATARHEAEMEQYRQQQAANKKERRRPAA